MHLSKLHATGNDFLVRIAGDPDDHLDAVTVAALCDRHRGIGADGLITIGPSAPDGAHCSMLLQNADGGIAEMSGNGIRCLAWVAAAQGLGDGDRLTVATGAGRREVVLTRGGDGGVLGAEVDMGPARFGPTIDIDFDGPAGVGGVTTIACDSLDLGNPHVVVLVDSPDDVAVSVHGPRIERDPRFPHRTNVEFAVARSRREIAMRVWERGVGETLSCGTGVCAAAASLHRRGLVDDSVAVHVPGGVLTVALGETITLGGPVVHVFDVTIDRERLLAALR